MQRSALFIALLFMAGTASAAVVPSALFSDNAVLQADREVPVWGWDTPGQVVTVTVGQSTASATTGTDGRWEVRLPAMPASEVTVEMTFAGSSTVTAKNVLVGEVWVGSGQSNMEMPLDWGVFGAWGTPECSKAFKEMDFPKLRLFKVARQPAGEGTRDVIGSWQVCAPMQTMKWSAACYFFGRELQERLGGTPVGIINTAVGGTQIAPWIDRPSVLALNPAISTKVQGQWDDNAKKMAAYQDTCRELIAKAGGQQAKLPKPPARPWPSSLYNGMVAPLMPYAVRGVAWYQGESNTGAQAEDSYAKTLETLIQTWRAAWKQDRLPFIVVQLPNYSLKGDFPQYASKNSKPVQVDPVEVDARWPPIREAQRRTAATVPDTSLLVSIDIGDPTKVHPTNKAEIGRRWALLALRQVYGQQDVVASGPLFAGCTCADGKAVVTFTAVDGGLAAKDGGELKGFAIAGADGQFVWAKAVITGDTVVLSADSVPAPTAVRYAWAENPIGNLVNATGLPASPFKTDGAAVEAK